MGKSLTALGALMMIGGVVAYAVDSAPSGSESLASTLGFVGLVGGFVVAVIGRMAS